MNYVLRRNLNFSGILQSRNSTPLRQFVRFIIRKSHLVYIIRIGNEIFRREGLKGLSVSRSFVRQRLSIGDSPQIIRHRTVHDRIVRESPSLFALPILYAREAPVSRHRRGDKRLIAHRLRRSVAPRGDAEGGGVIGIDTRGQRDSPLPRRVGRARPIDRKVSRAYALRALSQ